MLTRSSGMIWSSQRSIRSRAQDQRLRKKWAPPAEAVNRQLAAAERHETGRPGTGQPAARLAQSRHFLSGKGPIKPCCQAHRLRGSRPTSHLGLMDVVLELPLELAQHKDSYTLYGHSDSTLWEASPLDIMAVAVFMVAWFSSQKILGSPIILNIWTHT